MIDNLRTIINKTLNQYSNAKQNSFKNNQLANYFRTEPKRYIESYIKRTGFHFNYDVKSSVGKGRWAIVPWIVIFDTDISTSATEGIYIAYLFAEDMSKVYLSLAQGWTYYHNEFGTKIGQTKIKAASNYWRKNLRLTSNTFTTKEIHLIDPFKRYGTSLPRGYELGNIMSIEYDADNLPDNQKMEDDLALMIQSLEELKSKLISTKDIDLSNKYILSRSVASNEHNGNKHKRTPIKRNYDQQSDANRITGLKGERYVIEYEKHQLRDHKKLQSKVEQVSVTQGDGLGYDILSFNLDGSEKHIEVKTTTDSKNTPFYISQNERQYAKDNSSSYWLYRVYDINQKVKNVKLEKYQGNLEQYFAFEPTDYLASKKDK